MLYNLPLYHKMLRQLRNWLPNERITRLRNMSLLVTGLKLSQAIHLSKIVNTWPIDSKLPCLVTRLNRFLNNEHVTTTEWYRPLLKQVIACLQGQPLRLIIDCTKVGFHYRLMTVSLAYKKRTIPLAWSVHEGSKGHVTVSEQIKLFKAVLPFIPAGVPVWVLGDAGFESVDLMRWLRRQGWSFVIRQNGRTYVRQTDQPWRKLSQIEIQEGETKTIGWVRLTKKHDIGWYFLVIHWAKGEDDPWYLVSNHDQSRQLIRRYKTRMWVEEMYGDMKGHGFDLEATHLDSTDRIDRLFLAVCFAFVWLIALGSWVVKNGHRHLLDCKSRRDKSYFRLGWDWVDRSIRLGKDIPIRFVPYP